MKTNAPYVTHKVENSIYTQTSHTGKLRWVYKPLYDEPILQQQEVVNYFENYVIAKTEVKWVDIPVEYETT